MNLKPSDALSALDVLWDNHNMSRSYFPYMNDMAVGERRIATAPWYQSQGYKVTIEFDNPITQSDRSKNNDVAGWQNENFIVRLCTILEYAKVIPKKDPGWMTGMMKEAGDPGLVALTVRLRNYIIHEMGRYNPEDPEHQASVKLMQTLLGVSLTEWNTWDTSIDKVLRRLFDACKRYTIASLSTK